MSIFAKCHSFYHDAASARGMGYPTNPRTLEALGLYPYFLTIDRTEGPEIVAQGRRCVMLGSNNYLGLTTHPDVQRAAAEALETYGTGCTGSRLLNGTLSIHVALEERLARFVGKERALIFPSGFQTNVGTIAALAGKKDKIIADKEVHASIVDGIRQARANAGVEARFFRHNDVAHLERLLSRCDGEGGRLVMVDAIYSMGGDMAPLPEIVRVCRRHGAGLLVDDAHGLGVLGQGRGTVHHLGLTEEVDLIMGTFSKSLASCGGFIAGSREVIHWIQHFARPFIFSASLPPANVATVMAALDVIEREPERVRSVNRHAERLRGALQAIGFDIGASAAAIIPIVVGDQFRTVQVWKRLFEAGVYVNVALPPSVPPDRALLRASLMATHTEAHVEAAIAAFESDEVRRLFAGTRRAIF